MAAGFSVGGLCFSTEVEALDAHYSALEPVAVSVSNTQTLIHAYTKANDVWSITTYSVNPASGAVSNLSSVSAPANVVGACTTFNNPTENFTDGMTLGWAVAAAMIAAYAIRRIYK